MLFRIDSLAATTIVDQLVDQVKHAIARGELRRGDKLPSVRELAATVTVNPKTIVKAYEILQQAGAIVRRHGAGCFVTDARKALRNDERRRQVRELVRKVLTEAYHLDSSVDELREIMDEELGAIRATKDTKRGAS